MWLCRATTWMPALRSARSTGCTSSAVMMKSPSTAADSSEPEKAAQVVRPIEPPTFTPCISPRRPIVTFTTPSVSGSEPIGVVGGGDTPEGRRFNEEAGAFGSSGGLAPVLPATRSAPLPRPLPHVAPQVGQLRVPVAVLPAPGQGDHVVDGRRKGVRRSARDVDRL